VKTKFAAALFFAGTIWAQDGAFQTVCTNATLEGDYGFIVTGTRPSGSKRTWLRSATQLGWGLGSGSPRNRARRPRR